MIYISLSDSKTHGIWWRIAFLGLIAKLLISGCTTPRPTPLLTTETHSTSRTA